MTCRRCRRTVIMKTHLPKEAAANAVTFFEQTDPFDVFTFALQKVVCSGKTAYQNVMIADTFNYGRALFLDGSIPGSEDDESRSITRCSYSRPCCGIPIRARRTDRRRRRATLREVLVHASVNSVKVVDLDREVVELCREHLINWHRGAFEDRRVRLIYGDGRKFVEDDDGHYDVVIVDVVDMLDNGPAQALYTRQFYERLRRRLRGTRS